MHRHALRVCLAAPARAEEVKAGDLVITQAWSRATPGGAKIGGGYLTIENKGSAPDRLIGGSADVAGKVEVHEMAMNNGVMTMRPLDKGLTIEPGKTVKLAPGGYHLMMFDLKSPLKQGDKLPVTLEFEKAGKVTVSLDVQGVGAQAPAGGGRFGRQDGHEEDALRHEDVRADDAQRRRCACRRRSPCSSAFRLAAAAPLAIHIHSEHAMFQVLVSPGTVGTDSFVLQLMTGDGNLLRGEGSDAGPEPAGARHRAAGAQGQARRRRLLARATTCRFLLPGRWHLRIDALIATSGRSRWKTTSTCRRLNNRRGIFILPHDCGALAP